jgi:hypothetical protein
LVAQSVEPEGAEGGVQMVLDRVLAQVVAIADLGARKRTICRCRLVKDASAGR